MTQSRNLLPVAGVAFLLFGIAVAWLAIRLVQANREDDVATAPLLPQQDIRIALAGELVVMIETPRTATGYRQWRMELVERATGRSQTVAYSPGTAQGAVYGVTTAKVPLGRITARPGTYTVRVFGLDTGGDYSRFRILMSRPYLGRMALQIIGLVICGVGLLLSVIWACWLEGWMKSAATS